MSSIAKNLLIVFTFVCIIVLAVFCIELVTLNADSSKSGDEGTQVSESPPIGATEGDDGQEPADTGLNGETEPPGIEGQTENGGEGEGQSQTPSGKRYSLLMLDNEHTLIIYADEELFDFSEGEADWLFTYKGGGEASLEIAPDLVTPQDGIQGLAETLLTPYLEGGESTVVGEEQIRNSTLNGISVIGEIGKTTYEAWIYGPLAGGNSGNALDFIIKYQNEEQKEALYEILDTLEMLLEETPEEELEDGDLVLEDDLVLDE
ncbi:MAG: hypothetical protein FWH57_03700 [Oscillospiraceae bacterium]|nr:hypothetical protein [Oscillospiraceae bacterium]